MEAFSKRPWMPSRRMRFWRRVYVFVCVVDKPSGATLELPIIRTPPPPSFVFFEGRRDETVGRSASFRGGALRWADVTTRLPEVLLRAGSDCED